MNYKKILLLSILLIILSVIMFLTGIGLFAYKGNQVDPLIVKLGEISFVFWIPTLVLGILLFFISIVLLGRNKSK
ncbi:hypothetical protein BXY58_3132 [Epilithonimonas arachidiradicis]|uniref:DUF3955 domain-containing protein n=1 Tax=Epilithonimonas arachidiradicis TaxID=1617282 RepID=A0A420CMX6_9FLAO|nr:hypothetical protein BXY58_3132 [Epilithonimonas arachidiradicis]GGG51994.1 hypothetical protein GCM10007332_12060 [Epilithonimonas arachidiradicis]